MSQLCAFLGKMLTDPSFPGPRALTRFTPIAPLCLERRDSLSLDEL